MARAGVFINVVGKVDSAAFGKAHAELRRLQAEAAKSAGGIAASFDRARAKMSAAGTRAISVGKKMSLGLTLPLALGGKAAFDLASDLQESESKARAVFGRYAKGLEKVADTAADKMGLSRQEFLESTGTLGALFTAMEIGRPKAAKMSKTITTLGSDLASFYNTSTEDALTALKSGLVGEAEPLRRFGVNINQARIEAEALSLGLVKGAADMTKVTSAQSAVERAMIASAKATKKYGKDSAEARAADASLMRAQDQLAKATAGQVPALTAAQKAQATYSLILKDSKVAQGDYLRTAGGAANQSRSLTANLKDAGAEIGQKLLPIITKLVGWFSRLISKFRSLGDGTQNIILIGAVAAAAAGPVTTLVGAVLKLGAGVIGTGQKIAGLATKAGPAVKALGRFRDGFRDAGAAQSAFSGKLGTLGGKLRSGVNGLKKGGSAAVSFGKVLTKQAVAGLKAFGAQIGRASIVVVTQWIPALASSAAAMIAATWPILAIIAAVALVVAAAVLLWKNWDKVWGAIKAVVAVVWRAIVTVISTYIEIVKTILITYLNIWKTIFTTVWRVITTVISAAWNAIKAVVTTAITIVSTVISTYVNIWKTIFTTAWNGIKAVVTTAIGLVRAVIENFVNGVKVVWTAFWSGLKAVVSGVVSGVVSTAKGLVNGVIGVVNGLIGFWNRIEFKAPKVHVPGTNIDFGGFTVGLPDIPKIPTLHGGGVYHAPASAREGLALLRDGERVLTPAQDRRRLAGARSVSDGNRIVLQIAVDARDTANPAEVEARARRGAQDAVNAAVRELTVLARSA